MSDKSRNPLIPRLCFGSLAISPLQRQFAPLGGAQLLLYAARQGVTMIDTAEYYQNYPSIAIALREQPDLTIITKSYAWDRAGALESVSKAQREMGRQFIDAMLMHEQEGELTVRGHWDALTTYRELKAAGEIGAVGLSTHRIAGVRAAVKFKMDAVCAIINMDGLGLTDGSRDDMERALMEAHEAGLFVVGMKILGGGHLIGRRNDAIKYILGLNFLDAIAVGMASEAEIDYNVSVFQGNVPNANAARISGETARTLMIEEGCIGCGRCAERCGQGAIIMESGCARAIPERCIRCGYCAAVCPQVCIKIV
ncbi:MAG: aldo/keto reductase [Oscillospiraceae bacterium]|nr:aldo/keto reductase [Oscillospiraceae bacterium]